MLCTAVVTRGLPRALEMIDDHEVMITRVSAGSGSSYPPSGGQPKIDDPGVTPVKTTQSAPSLQRTLQILIKCNSSTERRLFFSLFPLSLTPSARSNLLPIKLSKAGKVAKDSSCTSIFELLLCRLMVSPTMLFLCFRPSNPVRVPSHAPTTRLHFWQGQAAHHTQHHAVVRLIGLPPLQQKQIVGMETPKIAICRAKSQDGHSS